MTELTKVTLDLDELEALRLADLEGLYQEAAAQLMHVSRQTFARILQRARQKVAHALIDQQALLIGEGPVIRSGDDAVACPVHGPGPRRGRGCRCRHNHRTAPEEDS